MGLNLAFVCAKVELRLILMNTYNKVEKLYNENINYFKLLEKEFSNNLNIPSHILMDTIKRVLVESIHPYGKKSFLLHYSYAIKDFFIYYIVMIYLFILALFPKNKKNIYKFDIVFDCDVYYDFDSNYRLLYEKLKNYSIAIFSRIGIFKQEDIFILNKKNTKKFDSEISYKILKSQFNNFGLYKELSKKSNINFINLSLRLMRYIALYETDSKNFSTNIFISAGDIYYNSLRYYIYHTNGINNIVLLQSGMKGGINSSSSGDLYIYSDYYFGYGTYFIDNLYGNIQYKIASGSIKLYQETYNKQFSETTDIVFIEQMAFIEIENEHSMKTYLDLVNILIKFANKYKNYNIVYRIRPLKLSVYYSDKEKMNIVNDLYNRMQKSGIIIDDFSETSYDAILQAKIIVFYTSALGFEALGLNKKTLCCNVDKLSSLPCVDEIGVLVEKSYALFEKKLLYLLNDNNDNNIKRYYEKQKNRFQNLEGSPVDKIVSIIKEKVAIR